jgi:toxin-antitoxin system PIN domain toxin
VILVDANLLLYAYDRSSAQHEPARVWFESALRGQEPVRFAWVTLLAFVRIATNPRAFARPLALGEAFGIVTGWMAVPLTGVLQPTERHLELLRATAIPGQARGPLLTDAHLASLAIEHGATLCTTDRDFVRFQGLRFVNPLSGQ